jgi:hypothetical protein
MKDFLILRASEASVSKDEEIQSVASEVRLMNRQRPWI